MKVLVVEDGDDVRDMVALALELDGHDVTAVADAEAAIEHLFEPFDAVLLDVSLPGMSGLELLDVVRSKPERAHMRAYVISAHASGHLENEALERGADGYLVKPFSLDDLLGLLTR